LRANAFDFGLGHPFVIFPRRELRPSANFVPFLQLLVPAHALPVPVSAPSLLAASIRKDSATLSRLSVTLDVKSRTSIATDGLEL